MATKTISIDLEAYRVLTSARMKDESFSRVIKRLVRPRVNVSEWLDTVRKNRLAPEALDAIEQAVANRRRPSTRER